MVARPHPATHTGFNREIQSPDLKWTTVGIQEVAENDYRLEASVYSNAGRQAREDLEQCRWPIKNLCAINLVELANSYHRPRFKRVYVEANRMVFQFIQPAQVT